MTGHNTKIPKHRLGDPRFGTDRDEPANGEPVTYTLSEEERLAVIAKYGPPKCARRVISGGLQAYWDRKRQEEGGFNMTSMLETARDKLTREVYLRLKNEGLGDVAIIKKLGLNNASFYAVKKELGLAGIRIDNVSSVPVAPVFKPVPEIVAAAPDSKQEPLIINQDFEQAVVAMEEQHIAQVPEPEQVIEQVSEPDPTPEPEPAAVAPEPPIEWILPNTNAVEEYIAFVNKSGVSFSRLASEAFLNIGKYLVIGVQGENLVFAACGEKNDMNYTLGHITKTSSKTKISGRGLLTKLNVKGIQIARYRLEYSEQTGLWIGTKI